MYSIKLDNDMKLVTTVQEPIYRGDNLSRKIRFLVPLVVGEIDVLAASIYLTYIRADGIPDIIVLERLDDKYNESYYQYVLPVNCKISKYPGELCMWVQIYSGTPSNPTIAKSGECMIQIKESKNIDDYLCDHQTTALYQIQKTMEKKLESVNEDIAKVNEELVNKADNLTYNDKNRRLQLVSGEDAIGESIVIPSDDYANNIIDDIKDIWNNMEDADGNDGNSEWEEM